MAEDNENTAATRRIFLKGLVTGAAVGFIGARLGDGSNEPGAVPPNSAATKPGGSTPDQSTDVVQAPAKPAVTPQEPDRVEQPPVKKPADPDEAVYIFKPQSFCIQADKELVPYLRYESVENGKRPRVILRTEGLRKLVDDGSGIKNKTVPFEGTIQELTPTSASTVSLELRRSSSNRGPLRFPLFTLGSSLADIGITAGDLLTLDENLQKKYDDFLNAAGAGRVPKTQKDHEDHLKMIEDAKNLTQSGKEALLDFRKRLGDDLIDPAMSSTAIVTKDMTIRLPDITLPDGKIRSGKDVKLTVTGYAPKPETNRERLEAERERLQTGGREK